MNEQRINPPEKIMPKDIILFESITNGQQIGKKNETNRVALSLESFADPENKVEPIHATFILKDGEFESRPGWYVENESGVGIYLNDKKEQVSGQVFLNNEDLIHFGEPEGSANGGYHIQAKVNIIDNQLSLQVFRINS